MTTPTTPPASPAEPYAGEEKGACPVCGCEEVDHRNLWTCRCPAPASPAEPCPASEVGEMVERLRERTALRYMGDCKCGKCRLVPREMVDAAADLLARVAAEREDWERWFEEANQRSQADEKLRLEAEGRLAEVEKERDEIRADYMTMVRAETERRKVAEAALEKAREALRWYADQMCEHSQHYEGCGKLPADDCAGCPARAALAAMEPGDAAGGNNG